MTHLDRRERPRKEMSKIRTLICPRCGVSFDTSANHVKYCPSCRFIQVKKPVITKKCLYCGNEFNTTRFWAKFCSGNCKYHYYCDLGDEVINEPYSGIRDSILARDNYTCQECGKTEKDGVRLIVHHKGLVASDNNLVTLCQSCHVKEHLKHPEIIIPHKEHLLTLHRVCEYCLSEFTTSRSWARFCSTKCRNAYHRRIMEETLKNG